MKSADMPAMPFVKVIQKGSYNGVDIYEAVDGFEGVTKREQFAAMAMQGLLSANATYGGKTNDRNSLAVDAVAFADALLKELEK